MSKRESLTEKLNRRTEAQGYPTKLSTSDTLTGCGTLLLGGIVIIGFMNLLTTHPESPPLTVAERQQKQIADSKAAAWTQTYEQHKRKEERLEQKKEEKEQKEKDRKLKHQFDLFYSRLQRANRGTGVIDKLRTDSEDDVEIVVTSTWNYLPFRDRLQMAQGIWKTWASIHSPTNLDKSKISLIDEEGNSVGGSSSFVGSVVSVVRE